MRIYTLDGRCCPSGSRIREARVRAGMSREALANYSACKWRADGRKPD